MPQYKEYLGLGIAGNFALHLDQAGEADDFKDIITADEAAPKGIFPFYLPTVVSSAKKILNTYPLDAHSIQLPKEKVNVQAEPEVGLLCDIEYKDAKVVSINPTHFGAFNDCSIRIKGASKISDKKNWGASSKGISDTLFEIDKFSQGGIMDNFSIASFLLRDAEVHPYGEDVKLSGYSYFYAQLTEWIIKQINAQEDFGPLEPILSYITEAKYPSKVIISIGATRYTPYGESTFLKAEDEVIIAVYNNKNISQDVLLESIKKTTYDSSQMSILSQKVV